MEKLCDICKEMIILLSRYDGDNDSNEDEDENDDDDDNDQTLESLNRFERDDLNTLINYINNWSTKHCACCYTDQRNFHRFDKLVQSLIRKTFKFIDTIIEDRTSKYQEFFDDWNNEDKEKLLLLMSKVFQLSFPLYVTYKHSNYTKNDELSTKKLKILSNYCNLHEYEMPIFLMRKIILFIELSGFEILSLCFQKCNPERLTLSFAHSLISTIQCLKYYFNVSAINSQLVLLRKQVINYLDKIGDNDLRNINNRAMFEFIWSVVKEFHSNHFHSNDFSSDQDGLKIAFKYFTSSTLTMRLSGLAQINNYIGTFNDLPHAPNNVNIENIRNNLCKWLIDHKIIENIYGPNSHVEMIKQSHFILNFIASKLTIEHIDLIWSAGQLKHYERYVMDILFQLIKSLKISIIYHLYDLLWKMKAKDHSEHTLNLASQIIKYIWLYNGIQPDMIALNNNCAYITHDKFTVDENILNKNLLISSLFKDRTMKTNSSSASSIEVSEDDDEDEDEDDEDNEFEINIMSRRNQTTILNRNEAIPKFNVITNCEESNQSSDSEFELENANTCDHRDKCVNFKANANNLNCHIQIKELIDDEWDNKIINVNDNDENEVKIDLDSLEEHSRPNSNEEQKQSVNKCKDNHRFRISDVDKPGNTLLYDILQDDMLNTMNKDLASLAEKIFWNTICCASDREIRYKFIGGCLENLAKNYSVITSLRLLQKLFSSFYQYQEGKLIRKIIYNCDKEKNMLKLFFNNLSLFINHYKYSIVHAVDNDDWFKLKSKFYSPKEEIQIRLNFLSFIYIYAGSNESLMFSQEHIDILWDIFTNCESIEIMDEFFDWLSNQFKLNNCLKIDLMKHILLEKMPLLKPETFTLISLDLLQNLHGFILSNAMAKNFENPRTLNIVIKLLWDITFENANQNVSMNASRHLNNYYINLLSCTNRFDKEEEFIRSCIKYLKDASILLPISCNKSLLIIERAVILLKTYLETFYARYSYFFRMIKLRSNVDHPTMLHHSIDKQESSLITIMVCTSFNSERKTFEFSLYDYIGDLRAEVQYWWCSLRNADAADADQLICLVLNDHEISFDCDEKRLLELNFKDNQINNISFNVCKNSWPMPSKSSNILKISLSDKFIDEFKLKNPKNFLIEKSNFELLFILMQQLDMINVNNLKARILSRNIWEIIQMLPTPSSIISKFKRLETKFFASADGDISVETDNDDFYQEICPSNSNQKLIYYCQLVENYRKINKHWPKVFIDTGGLRFFYRTFIDVVGSIRVKHDWTEWKQDCLASLIQILYRFIKLKNEDVSCNKLEFDKNCDSSNTNSSIETKRNKRMRKNSSEKNLIIKFNSDILAIIGDDKEKLMDAIMIILDHVFISSKIIYQTSIWSRSQVVMITLTFFTSWCHSDPEIFEMFLINNCKNAEEIIKKLLIDDSDPMVRKESSNVFLRLFLNLNAELCARFLPKFLVILLSFLEEAAIVNIPKMSQRLNSDDKEVYYPGNRDYFILVCRLIDHYYSLKNINSKDDFDAQKLPNKLANLIVNRENFESSKNQCEDEGLKGILLLLTVILKNNEWMKGESESKELIVQIFDSLFTTPYYNHRKLPKCKNIQTRRTAFDLLLELIKNNEENYQILTNLLIDQHRHEIIGRNVPYPWEYWPQDESRTDFVGLTNLGATCYMASCMQHLFMLIEVRNAILTANISSIMKHESILRELQKMFIFLQESERKSYNPKSFCKVYTMDHQPLNICEQKDMTEFFTDLITKLEEMTLDLKDMVKKHFSGLQSNNVVSLDCPHISQTMEEFYTLRCQVADMRDLYESLNELTVKDTLDGDNMYNCSICGRKVRAEKRACIKKLPKILCFNTMRYTFNMITMTKEKVNTHFSFPFTLDMAPYLEKNLLNLSDVKRFDGDSESNVENDKYDDAITNTKYELIGVTVHTGTAEGGHYYCFIQDRDPNSATRNKWFLFNDAEVKQFDKTQIATECFGGEMTSKTYDKTNDKFLDFSFEKTNSAYMLFYEKCEDINTVDNVKNINVIDQTHQFQSFDNHISKELIDWIWNDNVSFIRDKLIFEHTYFDFIWRVVILTQTSFNQQSVTTLSNQSTLTSIRLATLFVLETLIHAKEKPTIPSWIELLIKQFNNSKIACKWIIEHLAENDWWTTKILFKCSNQTVRQIFVRLCIHVIQKLKPSEQSSIYLKNHLNFKSSSSSSLSAISINDKNNDKSSSTKLNISIINFIRRLVQLINSDVIIARPNIKYLVEYFSFLLEFAKQGDEECQLLLSIGMIETFVNFYLNHGKISGDFSDSFSDNEDDDFDDRSQVVNAFRPVLDEKYPRRQSLDKMLSLIVYLVERKTQRPNFILLERDFNALISDKNFHFIQQQIRDGINLKQTFNLIYFICNLDETLFPTIINMIISSIIQYPESSSLFFQILSFITETAWFSSHLSKLILPRIWDLAEPTTLQTLDWLIQHVPRNKMLHDHVLSTLDHWVIHFLVENSIARIRSSTAQLLICLVPSPDNSFRSNYRPFRTFPYSINKEISLTKESLLIIDQLFSYLLGLIKKIRIIYSDSSNNNNGNNTQKLTNYFFVLTYLMVNTKQKRLFLNYFNDFWLLFQMKLSEPAIPIHQNKQAFLIFLYVACQECKDTIRLIVQNPNVYKKIAFNYILADHDDQEVVMFNKSMLPYYYGLLRICCQYSQSFTRYLASHQNIQWAFKNITPYSNHYSLAINELFKLIRLFVDVDEDSSEQELKEVMNFKNTTLKLYLQTLDPNVHWGTIISVLNILIETNDDRLFVIRNNGLYVLIQSFSSLNIMFHQATACHITNELIDLLKIISSLLETLEQQNDDSLMDYKSNIKTFLDMKKFLYLLNSYTPANLREALFDVLFKLIKVFSSDYLIGIVKFLLFQHMVFAEQNYPFIIGPYFPKRGQKVFQTKSSLRPSRPTFQMCFHVSNLDAANNHEHNGHRDFDYDQMVYEFYRPYYSFINEICRFAIKQDLVFEELVDLSVKLAMESIYFRNKNFIILWLDIVDNDDYRSDSFVNFICVNKSFNDYLRHILFKEKCWLEDEIVFRFLKTYLPKVSPPVCTVQIIKQNIFPIIDNLSKNHTVNCIEVVQQLISNLLAIKLFVESNQRMIKKDEANDFSSCLNNLKQKFESDEDSLTDNSKNDQQEKSIKKLKLMNNDETVISISNQNEQQQQQSSSTHFENLSTDNNSKCDVDDLSTIKTYMNPILTIIDDICELLNNSIKS